MSSQTTKFLKFGSAMVIILLALGYLAYTGVQESKSYYVTIKELRGMGDEAYTKRLRVAGNVQPGSIKRSGTNVNFVLVENEQLLNVVYNGTEPPPDTRAYFRGKCLQRWASSISAANWDSLVFDLGSDPLRRVPMMEPLRGTAAHVDNLLAGCSSPAELLEQLGS